MKPLHLPPDLAEKNEQAKKRYEERQRQLRQARKALTVRTSHRKRTKILDERRKAEVLLGLGGFEGTPLERTLAFRSEYGQHLDDVLAIVRLAWTLPGRDFFRDLTEHAAKQPDTKGLADALRATRRVWRHVFVDPPPPDRTKPVQWDRHQLEMLWLSFTTAWSRACEKAGRKVAKGPVREQMARAANPNRPRKSSVKRPRWMTLTTARQIRKYVEKFERETPPDALHHMYRQRFPKSYPLMGIPPAPARPRRKAEVATTA